MRSTLVRLLMCSIGCAVASFLVGGACGGPYDTSCAGGCDPKTTYCQLLVSDNPDTGCTSFGQCLPLPMTCASAPTCACIGAAEEDALVKQGFKPSQIGFSCSGDAASGFLTHSGTDGCPL